MTICIAAKSKEDYVVVASDRMVTFTLPSTEFQQGIPKTLEITNNCVACTAGSALAYTPMYNLAKIEIQTKKINNISQIAEINRNYYVLMCNTKMDQEILARIGLNFQLYFQMNQHLSPQIIANTFQAMTQYDYGLSLLLAGVDESGGHVYRIDNPGRMEPFDSLGYCAVGSGELHAISTFVANDYRHDLDLDHVLALTYEAKRRSEKAQGVGEKSDIYIVTKENCLQLSDNEIKKLDNIYNMKSEQEKKV